jgi:alpha-D-ribose 1-methylphosphonate 5-phosphate C-P lyase
MLQKYIIILVVFMLFPSSSICFAQHYDIRFGILVGDHVAEETTVIPFFMADTGFRYGFTISHNSNRSYKSYSVHRLPASPITVGGIIKKSEKPTRRIETREEEIIENHSIEEFGFEPGDPLGIYKLDIYINGCVAKSITYKVVTPEEYKQRKH